MRCQHTSHELPSFPVYSLGFLDDDKLILGGGGGAGKSGIKNELRLYDVKPTALDLLDKLELEKDEDAPMTLAVASTSVNTPLSEAKVELIDQPKTPSSDAASSSRDFVCGINSSLEKRKSRNNQNCRVFGVSESNKLSKKQTTSTLQIVDENADDYQRVTRFDTNGERIAVGCTNNQVSILSYPSLSRLAHDFLIPKDGGDLYDIDFTETQVVVCGSKKIYLLSAPDHLGPKSSSDEWWKPVEVQSTIDVPTIIKGSTHTFRSARIGSLTASTEKEKEKATSGSSSRLYAIINTTPQRSLRGGARTSFVCAYTQKDGKWEMLGKPRAVSNRAVTVFDVSASRNLLAYGSSDLSVGILDSRTLAPLVQILNAHEFPPTVLRFNPSSSRLVSGSADNSIRVVEVPSSDSASGGGMTTSLFYIIMALLVLILGAIIQQNGWRLP